MKMFSSFKRKIPYIYRDITSSGISFDVFIPRFYFLIHSSPSDHFDVFLETEVDLSNSFFFLSKIVTYVPLHRKRGTM